MKRFFTLIAVAALAIAAQGKALTVCSGTDEGQITPFYGFMMDTKNTICQMIYPADLLTEMRGYEITTLFFRSTGEFTGLGQGNLQVALKVVDQDHYESTTLVTGATVCGNGYPRNGAVELQFDLDNPFYYERGNLLIETTLTQEGTFSSTKFRGKATELVTSIAQYGYSWSTSYYYEVERFLPEVCFYYEEPAGPPIEMCAAPAMAYYITDNGQAVVTIYNYEPEAFVDYQVYQDGYLMGEDEFFGESYSFTVSGPGFFMIRAVAKKEDMLDSETSALTFFLSDAPQPPVKPGDANGDSIVNIDDVTALINYLLTDDASGINLQNANCNNDDFINIDDVTALINYLLTDAW